MIVPVRARFASIVLCLAMMAAGLSNTSAYALQPSSITATINTWSCPPGVTDPELETGEVPASCGPVDVGGSMEVHTRTAGTSSENVVWKEAVTTGASTTIEDIDLNGSDLFYRLPIVAGTARMVQMPGVNDLFPGFAGVAWEYENGERMADSLALISGEEMTVDVLYLESPLDAVPHASIRLVHWECEGAIDEFEIDECEARDAEPWLFAGPRLDEDVTARIPEYQVEGQTATLTALDPVTYYFGAADSGLAGATISQRTLILPTDGPQEVDANVFLPDSPDDKYYSLTVPISADTSERAFNVYEFEDE